MSRDRGVDLRNVEIKARIEDMGNLMLEAARLATSGPTEILQDDTFFPCAAGRLKLRDFLDGTGELIFYRRLNESGPKESFYLRSPTASPDSLRESLSLAYGLLGRVTKHRTLFLIGRTRLHLDNVANLGNFLELEVVLRDDESPEQGVREAHELMRALNIGSQQLIDCAYIDLLAELLQHSNLNPDVGQAGPLARRALGPKPHEIVQIVIEIAAK